MAVRSGLAGQVGIKAESTYGTYATVDRFHEVDNANLKKQKNVVNGGGLAAGRLVLPSSRRVVTAEDAAGQVTMDVTHKDMGIILAHIFGSTPTPTQQGVTTAYKQAHALADNVGKSLSIQVGVPDTSGTVRPYTYLGAKITKAEFKCGGPGELLKVTLDFDARQCVESQTLAAASFTSGLKPFHFAQMGVKLGTYNSEAAVDGIKGFTLTIERPQATDRFYGGNLGLKSEPVVNETVKVSGSFNADYVDKTILADRFAADSSTALIWEFIGPTIASTYKETVQFQLPVIFLDDTHATLEGPGVVNGEVPFTALYDGTNAPVTCNYTSTDTAL